LVIDDRSVPENDFVDQTMNILDRLHDESHVREYRPSEWNSLLHVSGFTIDNEELYTIHRPLSSLTNNVEATAVEKIHDIIARMTSEEKELMKIGMIDGELHINHWFIMIKARKKNSTGN
jgi:hypothetical protein